MKKSRWDVVGVVNGMLMMVVLGMVTVGKRKGCEAKELLVWAKEAM